MLSILPGLSSFNGLLVGRVYLIDDPGGLTIIDAGLELAADRIVKQLEGMGRRPSDVKRILITHGHPDHIGGLQALQAKTGARVFASAQDQPTIEGRQPVPTPSPENLSGLARYLRPSQPKIKGTPVTDVIGEGDVLPILGGLHVLFTPGHSHGHLSFWQPEKRILFCGDVMMRLPNLRRPFAMVTIDMAQNQRSLLRLVDLYPSVICFGHGRPMTEDTAAQLQAYGRKVGA